MRWLVPSLCLFAATRASAAPIEVRFGNIAPEGSSYDRGCGGALRTEVARSPATAAKVHVKLFMGAALGDEATMLRHTQEGKLLQVAALTNSAVAIVVPELAVFDLPFLFRDDAEVDAVFRSDKVRSRLRDLLAAHDLQLVGIAEAGWRRFASRERPIRSPADLAGLRVRSQPGAMPLDMWRTLGAEPRPLGITDLPAALEAGQIDAFDMQATFLFAASLHSLIHHYTMSNHAFQGGLLVTSRKAVSAATLKILQEAWGRAERTCIEAIRAENRTVDAELPKAGIQVTGLDPAARAAFEEKLAPLRQRFRKGTTPAGRALLELTERVLEQHRRRARQVQR